MTNPSDLIYRYRLSATYTVYVVYLATVFQLVGWHR